MGRHEHASTSSSRKRSRSRSRSRSRTRHREKKSRSSRDHRSPTHTSHRDRDRHRADRPLTLDSCACDADYKRLYKQMKEQCKERLRTVDMMEDHLKEKRAEVEKAKVDSADLWKIYYTLQQELQKAYDDNTKLQNDKKALGEQLEQKRGKDAASDPVRLRDELMKLQRHKLQMQGQYNEVVLENQRLSDRASTIEPRIAEIDASTKKLQAVADSMRHIETSLSTMNTEVTDLSCTKDTVERHQRWNSLLLVTSEQSGRLLHKLQPRAQQATSMNEMQSRMTELKETSNRESDAHKKHLYSIMGGVASAAADWSDLEREMRKCIKLCALDLDTVTRKACQASMPSVGPGCDVRSVRNAAVSLDDVAANVQGAIAAAASGATASVAVLHGAKAALNKALKSLDVDDATA